MQRYPEITEKLKGSSTRIELKKSTVLVLQGQMSEHIYFVESGCLRLWHNDDGKDVTVQFFQAGEAVGPLECIYWEQPSEHTLESVVQTVVFKVRRSDFLKIVDENPALNQFIIKALLMRVSAYRKRFLSTIKASPKERYEEFARENPKLLEMVPGYHIASTSGSHRFL